MDTKYLRPHYLVLFCHATLVLCQFTSSVPQSATKKLIDSHSKDISSSVPTEPIIHNLFSHPNPSGATSTSSSQTLGNETNKISEMQNIKNMSLASEGGPVNVSLPPMRTNTEQGENPEFSTHLASTPATLDEGLSPVISSNLTDTLKKPLLPSDQTSDSFPENHHHQTIGRKGAFDPTVNNQSTSNQPCIDNKENKCSVTGNESAVENTTLALLNQGLEKYSVAMKTENISLSPETTRLSPNASSVTTNYIFLNKSNFMNNSSVELNKKPAFTRDDSSKQQSLLSSPESKYIIPVVATILVVPLVVALGMFLYRRGAEFWERRHYRRMDFLIDGMYND